MPYPVGSNIEALLRDPQDPRICVLANDSGQYLKSPSSGTRPAKWASLAEALKINGTTKAWDMSQRYGGTVMHFHAGNAYEVNFYSSGDIESYPPGHVEVI